MQKCWLPDSAVSFVHKKNRFFIQSVPNICIWIAVLRSMLGAEPEPTKVLETKTDNYSERHIHCREEGLILYAPQNNTNNKREKSKYEIVLHKPCTESLLYAFRCVPPTFFVCFFIFCYCNFFVAVCFVRKIGKKLKKSLLIWRINCRSLLKLPKRWEVFLYCL